MEAKTSEFSSQLQSLSKGFKLLSHPARLQIIEFLSRQKSCLTGDISKDLPLSRTTVFQHLEVLKEAGWLKGEIIGARIGYCLDLDKIQEDMGELQGFLKDCCNSEGPCC